MDVLLAEAFQMWVKIRMEFIWVILQLTVEDLWYCPGSLSLMWLPFSSLRLCGTRNPVSLDQTWHNITMTDSTLHLLSEQTFALADSYWMFGDDILLHTLPPRWIVLSALVRIKLHVQVVYKGFRDIIGVDEFPDKIHRSKRWYTPDPRVYLDSILQPRGIPEKNLKQ